MKTKKSLCALSVAIGLLALTGPSWTLPVLALGDPPPAERREAEARSRPQGTPLVATTRDSQNAAQTQDDAAHSKVRLRIVILAEDDGCNPAVTLREVEERTQQLRAEGKRFAIDFEFEAASFRGDSRLRHVPASLIAQTGASGTPRVGSGGISGDALAGLFPPTPGDLVTVYVTGLQTAHDGPGFLITSPDAQSAYPAIVVDAYHFAVGSCALGQGALCAAFPEATAQVLTRYAPYPKLSASAESFARYLNKAALNEGTERPPAESEGK